MKLTTLWRKINLLRLGSIPRPYHVNAFLFQGRYLHDVKSPKTDDIISLNNFINHVCFLCLCAISAQSQEWNLVFEEAG